MTDQGLRTWKRNLGAFGNADHTSARLLQEPAWGRWRTFRSEPGGTVTAAGPSGSETVRDASVTEAAQTAHCETDLCQTDLWILPGIGTGQTVDSLLRAGNRVVVIEPEAGLVRWILRQFDWSEAIGSLRLRLRIPNFETPEFAEVSLLESGAELQDLLEREGGRMADVDPGHPSAQILRELIHAAKLPGELIRRVRAWPRAAASASVDVAVLSPNCLIFDDLARTLVELGMRTKLVRVTDQPRSWSRTRWLHVVRELRDANPKIILARNRTLLEIANPRERLDLDRLVPAPFVRWWWDIPNVAGYLEEWHAASIGPASTGSITGFAFARGILELLPPGYRWLPPAARAAFSEIPLETPRARSAEILFVGQSRLDALRNHVTVLAHHLPGRVGPDLASAVNRARGMQTLHQALREAEPACKESIHSFRSALPAHAYYLDYLLGMSVTASFRLAAIERLARSGLPIAVHGDAGWIRSGAVNADQYRGLVHPDHLADLYRSVRLNLNLNFMQVSTTVNPRVLDIAATGSAVLTDARPELVDLFPDPDARPSVFQGLDDLVDRATDLLRQDTSDSVIAAAHVVRSRHTLRHRAQQLIADLGLAPNSRPSDTRPASS